MDVGYVIKKNFSILINAETPTTKVDWTLAYTLARKLVTRLLLYRERSSYRQRWRQFLDGVCFAFENLVVAEAICTAFNIVVAFNMGQDNETILSNPIGQPMATVRRYIQ